MRLVPLSLALLALFPLAGCRSAYYGVMERFGLEKRDLLADRVEEGRDAQRAAKESFEDALSAFREVTGFRGGALEKAYDKLAARHEDAAERVEEVHERIASIERVARDLFDEWRAEARQISSADLRARSLELLAETRERYEQMLDAMKKAEAKMEPVLGAFHDRVLFLKHNLNAAAIASLGEQAAEIDGRVSELVRDMEASIAEADAFVASLQDEA